MLTDGSCCIASRTEGPLFAGAFDGGKTSWYTTTLLPHTFKKRYKYCLTAQPHMVETRVTPSNRSNGNYNCCQGSGGRVVSSQWFRALFVLVASGMLGFVIV